MNIIINRDNNNRCILTNKQDFRNLCEYNLEIIKKIVIPELSQNNKFETVYIEFRKFNHEEFLIRNTIIKLPDWSHTVVCGNDNFKHLKKIVENISKDIKIIKLDINEFTNWKYSELLMQESFWNMFTGEKILIYQEDSFLFHNKIEPFLDFDYVGAPWPMHQDEQESQIQYGVGNGGFSLRSKSKMIECIQKINWKKDLTFGIKTLNYMKIVHNDSIPEDVFFSKSLIEKNIGKVAPRNIAINFSQELLLSDDPLGGHNFYLASSYLNNKNRYIVKNIGLIQNTKIVGIYSTAPFTRGGGEKYLTDIMKVYINLDYKIYFYSISNSDLIKKTLKLYSIDIKKITLITLFNSRKLHQILNNSSDIYKFDYFLEMSNSCLPNISKKIAYKHIFHCQFPSDVSINTVDKITSIKKKNSIDLIIVNSDFTAHHLRNIYHDKLKILYPLCEIEKKKNNIKINLIKDNNEINFVTIGRLFKYNPRGKTNCKNIDFILDVFNHISVNKDAYGFKKNFKLHVICSVKDYSYFNELKNNYSRGIKNKNIIFYTDCSDTKKVEILNLSHYYLHATGIRNIKNERPFEEEHFGISLIEGIQHGCIPIVSDRGYPSYIIKHNENGYLFDNKNNLFKILIDVFTGNYNDVKRLDSEVINSNLKLVEKFCSKSIYVSNFLKMLIEI